MKSLRTEKKKCGEGGDSSVREGNESAIPSCYEDADTRCSLGVGTGLRKTTGLPWSAHTDRVGQGRGYSRLFLGDRSRRAGERDQCFLHRADEHDVELPL